MVIPNFSIVTRTKNRPIMLKRLSCHIAAQTYRLFEWVIVNDGGDLQAVKDIVASMDGQGIGVQIIHHAKSQGRSVAANVGVARAKGCYVVILDDDDYMSTDYLEKAASFFESYKTQFGAVTCYSQIINEELVGDQILVRGKSALYAPNTNDVSILGLHVSNIPTCGLFVKKELFEQAGGYPQDIDCTEDWAFITSLVKIANIGIIPQTLAFISHRKSPSGFYRNTTSDLAGIEQHAIDELLWKNNRIRNALLNNQLEGLLPLLAHIVLQNKEIIAGQKEMIKQIRKSAPLGLQVARKILARCRRII